MQYHFQMKNLNLNMGFTWPRRPLMLIATALPIERYNMPVISMHSSSTYAWQQGPQALGHLPCSLAPAFPEMHRIYPVHECPGLAQVQLRKAAQVMLRSSRREYLSLILVIPKPHQQKVSSHLCLMSLWS
ncbi:hypothetical protein M758_12G039000 [Ceratodon purpureus]|nr:hypothetical protein M758_12G039000 [Ceratodon purpureus]